MTGESVLLLCHGRRCFTPVIDTLERPVQTEQIIKFWIRWGPFTKGKNNIFSMLFDTQNKKNLYVAMYARVCICGINI